MNTQEEQCPTEYTVKNVFQPVLNLDLETRLLLAEVHHQSEVLTAPKPEEVAEHLHRYWCGLVNANRRGRYRDKKLAIRALSGACLRILQGMDPLDDDIENDENNAIRDALSRP